MAGATKENHAISCTMNQTKKAICSRTEETPNQQYPRMNMQEDWNKPTIESEEERQEPTPAPQSVSTIRESKAQHTWRKKVEETTSTKDTSGKGRRKSPKRKNNSLYTLQEEEPPNNPGTTPPNGKGNPLGKNVENGKMKEMRRTSHNKETQRSSEDSRKR